MTLIVLTVVVTASVITAWAVYLFMLGTVLGRTAGNLGDCQQNVMSIAAQAQVIGPGITRINRTGSELVFAIPLPLDGATGVDDQRAAGTAASVPT